MKSSYRLPFIARYSDRYLNGKYENGKQVGGRISYVRFFSLIAIFIIGIACINFMNLSTARASRRFKEIGIKKVAGASRSTLALQYLIEAIFITLIALALALILAAFFLPQFNAITGKHLLLDFSFQFILSMIGIAVFAGLISGSYPALYLSGFKPIAILKGKLTRSSGEIWTRKGLVVLQYSISVVLIVLVTIIYHQVEFIQNKSLGYNKDEVVHFVLDGKLKEQKHLDTFLNELNQLPGVRNVSSARVAMTGDTWGVGGIYWPGQIPNDPTYFQHIIAYYDLFETLDIELAAGRPFSRDFNNEDQKVIFNEAAIRHMGIEDPIGKRIKFWGREKEIVGVVKDFHFASLHEEIKPTIINFWPERLSSVMVKLEAGREAEALTQMESLYMEHNPEFLFESKFLDSNFQDLYSSEQRVSVLSRYFAGIAILISCLGLFGLAAFTAERRVKEIGIRKVLGASVVSIVRMLSGDFTKLVVTAICVGLPISYFVGHSWLGSFAYRISLEWWYFVISGFAVILIALAAVGWQTVKAAVRNPVDNLRSE